MAHSVIKLYKNNKILNGKNFIVQGITRYLELQESNCWTLNKMQFIKHDLNIQIKIPNSQEALNFYESNNFNYVSIQNKETTDEGTYDIDTYPVYYFVVSKEWRSVNTILLNLKMDVLNTFSIERNSFTFDKKTKILRQHKDRLELSDSNSYWRRKIDPYSEGFTPTLYKNIDTEKALVEDGTSSWHLMYRNQNDISEDLKNNPVECYILPDKTTTIHLNDHAGRLTPDNVLLTSDNINIIGIGKTLYLWDIIDGKEQFKYSLTIDGSFYAGFVLNKDEDDNKIKIRSWRTYGQNNQFAVVDENIKCDYITFEHDQAAKKVTEAQITNVQLRINQINALGTEISDFYSQLEEGQDVLVYGINSIDKTDPKIIKIIKLPYAPFEFTRSGDTYTINDKNYSINKSFWLIQLTNLNNRFQKELNFTNDSNPLTKMFVTSSTPSLTALRNDNYESKLLHSDFYITKYGYDSFNYALNFEKIGEISSSAITSGFNIQYYITSTINSRFMFYFVDYANVLNNFSQEDYSGYLIATRNNEEVLYNNAYINYIRTGYNYDVKAKNVSTAGAWVSGIISTAGALALAVATGGAISPAIALAVGGTSALIKSINTTISNENEQAKKQEAYKNQTTSIQGSDDVDLMSSYCGNKLHYFEYSVSDKLKKQLADLFYYCGYTANYQDVPNVSSRVWFNYLECELVEETLKNIPFECREELKTCFKNGVTYLHLNNSQWDFEQIKENWEVSLLEVE